MASLPLRRARWCGKNLVLLEEVDSTNTYLKQGDFPDGTAVIALRQTAGKGRTGRVWTGAEPGQGLYLSVLFHSMQIEDMGFLPLLCGLAVAKTLGRGAAIKWPNDLLIGTQKVCGILCESRIEGDRISAVCGIGLNLTQPREYFEQNDLPHGTSLLLSCGEKRTPLQAAAMILDELEPMLEQDRAEGFSPFLAEYSRRCITLGRDVLVLRQGDAAEAKAISVSDDGSLICEKDGETFVVRAGEASVRGLYGYV